MNRRLPPGLALLTIVGAAGTLLGAALDPGRTASAVLVVSVFLLGLGLAGGLGIALQYGHRLPGAALPLAACEQLTRLLPAGAVGLLAVVLLAPGMWSAADLHGFKAFWLERAFHLGRTVAYLLIWLLLVRALARNSAARRAGVAGADARGRRLAAVYFYVFGLTLTLASVDWLMATEPHWQSTIYGLYQFAGVGLAGLGAAILILLPRRPSEALRHDLGQLAMGFCCLWIYLWFSQFLLIWYTGIPEESTHYIVRLGGEWRPLFFLNVALCGVLPFVLLLPREWKSSAAVLSRLAALLLVGRWIDLHLLVQPSLHPDGPALALVDLAPVALALAVVRLLLAAGPDAGPPPEAAAH